MRKYIRAIFSGGTKWLVGQVYSGLVRVEVPSVQRDCPEGYDSEAFRCGVFRPDGVGLPARPPRAFRMNGVMCHRHLSVCQHREECVRCHPQG